MSESTNGWDTPIKSILHLANPEIYFGGCNLHIVLEDLDACEKWNLQVREVVGYRFTQNFGMKRIVNTFIIQDSAWISALHQEPMLIQSQLDGVCHYLIETMDGVIEILAKKEPSIFMTRVS